MITRRGLFQAIAGCFAALGLKGVAARIEPGRAALPPLPPWPTGPWLEETFTFNASLRPGSAWFELERDFYEQARTLITINGEKFSANLSTVVNHRDGTMTVEFSDARRVGAPGKEHSDLMDALDTKRRLDRIMGQFFAQG